MVMVTLEIRARVTKAKAWLLLAFKVGEAWRASLPVSELCRGAGSC